MPLPLWQRHLDLIPLLEAERQQRGAEVALVAHPYADAASVARVFRGWQETIQRVRARLAAVAEDPVTEFARFRATVVGWFGGRGVE